MNSKRDLKFKGEIAVMSFGPAATWGFPPCPAECEMDAGFSCLSVHTAACTWHRGQRPLVLPSKGRDSRGFAMAILGHLAPKTVEMKHGCRQVLPPVPTPLLTLSGWTNPAHVVPAHGRRVGIR